MRRIFVALFCVMNYPIVHAQLLDVSPAAELYTNHTSGFLGQGVSLVDINNDYADDVTFAHAGGAIRCYLNDGFGGFSEIDLGLNDLAGQDVKMVLWGDVDNDGDLDLFLTLRTGPNRLYLNDGELNLTLSESGLRQDTQKSYGACLGDLNGDGFLDLFVANYSDATTQNPVNELYLNAGVSTQTGLWLGFLDSGEQLGLEYFPGDQSFQAQFVDYNGDGEQEIHLIKDRVIFENQLFKFNAGILTDIAGDMGLDIGMNCMSTSVADFDCDLDDDVYLSGLQPSDSNLLMVNTDDGQFQWLEEISGESAPNLQPISRTSWAANWLDIDNNGWEDLHVGCGTTEFTHIAMFDPSMLLQDTVYRDALYMNHGGVFQQDSSDLFTTDEFFTFSTASGDINSDGFPDLISHRIGYTAQVLHAIPNGNNWLKLKLRGIDSNRDGIGARVNVYSSGHSQTRMVYAGENYLGQNSLVQHFGMGQASIADSIVIHWPAAGTTLIPEVPVNGLYLVVEDGGMELISGVSAQSGCTYPTACNFNSNAIYDDGMCDFTCLFESFCGEGTLWDAATGMCVIGNGSCASDLDNNGLVTLSDLLLFLTDFGSICGE